MSAAVPSRAARGAATAERLLDAVAAILKTEGAAAVSVQHVADAAGTSKGLVHYHFADKDALLVACAQRLTAQLVEAEGSALATSAAATALDDLWVSLERGRALGTRRALLALAASASPNTRDALGLAARARHESAQRTVERVAHLLGFAPRVALTTLALAYLAFADGIALDATVRAGPQHRQAFDAFWLAVLSLDGS